VKRGRIALIGYDKRLSQVLQGYMTRTIGLSEHCDRCLETRRWGGSVVLMVVDAAFTSIGLNYFTAVVPAVLRFEKEFIARCGIRTLNDLTTLEAHAARAIWKNGRSWQVVTEVATYLDKLAVSEGLADRDVLRSWAASSRLEGWRDDPIGRVKGVGITTFQYLRMMGGVDTAMPDKIVRRVIGQIVDEAGVGMPVHGDMELVSTIQHMAGLSGYRPIEICWMTWMVQSEGSMVRMEKYRDLLDRI